MIQENEMFEYSQYKEACESLNESQKIEYVGTINGVRKYKIVKIPEPTDKEIAEQEISILKQKLNDTDYQAIKYAEGLISDADYAKIKAQRQEWRDRINELEKES